MPETAAAQKSNGKNIDGEKLAPPTAAAQELMAALQSYAEVFDYQRVEPRVLISKNIPLKAKDVDVWKGKEGVSEAKCAVAADGDTVFLALPNPWTHDEKRPALTEYLKKEFGFYDLHVEKHPEGSWDVLSFKATKERVKSVTKKTNTAKAEIEKNTTESTRLATELQDALVAHLDALNWHKIDPECANITHATVEKEGIELHVLGKTKETYLDTYALGDYLKTLFDLHDISDSRRFFAWEGRNKGRKDGLEGVLTFDPKNKNLPAIISAIQQETKRLQEQQEPAFDTKAFAKSIATISNHEARVSRTNNLLFIKLKPSLYTESKTIMEALGKAKIDAKMTRYDDETNCLIIIDTKQPDMDKKNATLTQNALHIDVKDAKEWSAGFLNALKILPPEEAKTHFDEFLANAGKIKSLSAGGFTDRFKGRSIKPDDITNESNSIGN